MRITMIVGRAMYDVLDIERMNYEDLGNWGIDEPGGAKMHLHFFGRARDTKSGASICFSTRKTTRSTADT